MKLLFRIFLSLCFLLLGGYGYLSAYTPQDNVRNSSIKYVGLIEHASTDIYANSTLPRAERSHDKMECKDGEDEDEDEDESSHPVKKISKINGYLTSFFYVLATEGRLSSAKNTIFYSELTSSISFCRYILFRSIRV